MNLKNLKNKSIAILGFGREGKSTLNFLNKIDVKNITILDKNKISSSLVNGNIKVISGETYLDNLENYDYIFKTPGISPYNLKLIKHKDKFLSGAELFFDNYLGKSICVTGTKGKSTTSTLIYKTLKQAGYNVKLVGNIGNPVLDEIDIISGESFDYIVYEMSSYMLETLKPKCFISIINNIYDCHLDWHNGKPNYIKAKLNILDNSENKIVNFELKDIIKDSNISFFGKSGKYFYKNKSFFIDNKKVLEDESILLEGDHNRLNISAVIGVLDIIGKIDNNSKLLESLKYTLKTFSGLPHRLENIGTKNDIIFIDDAIATTPESTIAAIKTFGENIGTIFLGGKDDQFNFDNLRIQLEKYNIENIVLFPDTGNQIFGDFSKNLEFDKIVELQGEYSPKILKTNTMKKAIKFAFENTKKGKICILSCASPSFSLWKGFEEKGNLFKKEIDNY